MYYEQLLVIASGSTGFCLCFELHGITSKFHELLPDILHVELVGIVYIFGGGSVKGVDNGAGGAYHTGALLL
jgi:hypothetical protein